MNDNNDETGQIRNNYFDEALELDDQSGELSSSQGIDENSSIVQDELSFTEEETQSPKSVRSDGRNNKSFSKQKEEDDKKLKTKEDDFQTNITSNDENVSLKDTKLSNNNFFDVAFEADDMSIESQQRDETNNEANSPTSQNLSTTKVSTSQIPNDLQNTSTSLSEPTSSEDNNHHDDPNHDDTSSRNSDYRPNLFRDLDCSPQFKGLLKYVHLYQPHDVELETALKCFIPSFVPAIGEPDPFIKPPRPDGKPETLGLKVIDEPSPYQSDPAVLDLQLKALSKRRRANEVVHCIENAEQNKESIDGWISSIEQLHESRNVKQDLHNMEPSSKVNPKFPEVVMSALRDGSAQLPHPDIDMPLDKYAQALCLILDIPVQENNVISSVHSLFSYYIKVTGGMV